MTFLDILAQAGLDPKDSEQRAKFSQLQIRQITSDSRKVSEGTLFVAIKGTSIDGHAFILEAQKKGAVAVVAEELVAAAIPLVVASNTREFLDQSLHYFYGEPSLQLVCIGVTGTNGKTTTTHMIECVLNDQNLPTAVMGTIDHHLGHKTFETDMTTPGPELLHKRLREFLDSGAKAVAMEVSSHALEQRRADSVSFDVVAFTNLTRDHLDYHKTMPEYFAAKQRLFDDVLWKSRKSDRASVINTDDDYGRWLKTAPQTLKISYGVGECDLRVAILSRSLDRTRIEFAYQNQKYIVDSHYIGDHNAYNLAAAFGVACALRLNLDQAARSLSNQTGVKGRLERVQNKRGVYVFVDYAHTDDALINVLSSLKNLRDQSSPSSRIITVFGCGGDRDKGKRPMMAKAAQAYSDRVIVTSDNPRTEDPQTIINEIVAGFDPQFMKNVISETERRKAIEIALKECQPQDVVLIAGKGHEDYQIVGKEKRHFSDVETVEEILR